MKEKNKTLKKTKTLSDGIHNTFQKKNGKWYFVRWGN